MATLIIAQYPRGATIPVWSCELVQRGLSSFPRAQEQRRGFPVVLVHLEHKGMGTKVISEFQIAHDRSVCAPFVLLKLLD